MSNLNQIKKHWDTKAVEFSKDTANAMGNTLNDENLRQLEIEAIAKYMKADTNVLEVGCGNGYSTITFAKQHKLNICGMDYSKEMIKNANSLLRKNRTALSGQVSFIQGDILNKIPLRGLFDLVITERCLINLVTWENQMKAIIKIKNKLKKHGLFLMLEGFKDNLIKINKMREKFKLKPIDVVWHNLFFEKKIFEEFITNHFNIEKIDNFGSTYMLITRCYLHAIQKKGNKFNREWDNAAALLPNFGNYNYQRLYILRKK